MVFSRLIFHYVMQLSPRSMFIFDMSLGSPSFDHSSVPSGFKPYDPSAFACTPGPVS